VTESLLSVNNEAAQDAIIIAFIVQMAAGLIALSMIDGARAAALPLRSVGDAIRFWAFAFSEASRLIAREFRR
jgi:hypothetical protein